MSGQQKIIDCLNFLLADELMSRDQYFIHSEMYRNWGYTRLYERIKGEMGDEVEHARDFIVRILMLGGKPVVVPSPLNVCHDIKNMLEADLQIELTVRHNIKKAIVLAEEEHDYVTRRILVKQLRDTEEDHAYWLEQQLRLLENMGLENYIQHVSR